MKRLSLVLGLVLACLVAMSAAMAASVDDVAAGLDVDGVYVEQGAPVAERAIGDAVGTVRNAGERLSIAVLADEPIGGAAAFAEATVDRGVQGLVLVIAPDSVGYAGVTDVFTVDELDAALDRALETGGDDAAIAANFADELTGAAAGVSDGGGSSRGALVFLLVLVVGGGLFVWWFARRAKARATGAADARLAQARSGIQQQIDAVANDILDLEDEVRMAGNPRADRFFEEASETYRGVGDEFAAATTPQQLLDIANDLDEAIWQLDSAEALLDGNPLPARPERRTLEPPPRTRSEAARRPVLPAPPPQYRRRPTRRSSYSGAGMTDLIAVLGASMLSGRSRGGGLFGGGSAPGASSSRSAASRTPAPRRGGSGGKRIRGGGRRRR